MRRSEYDHVPNRIIPPHLDQSNGFRPEYERSARILPAPTVRQPLLGDAPQVNPYASSYGAPYSVSSYSNGIPEPRRRGFDKGPSGEDLRRAEGRQQLMRNPRLAVEHIGGDMDISRSRSASPDIQIVKARAVRDDRKKERSRFRRSRSRSRDRHDRGDRESSRRQRDRVERGGNRSTYEAAPVEEIRNGLLYTNENYYNFLMYYIDSLHDKIVSPMDRDGARKTNIVITDATQQEKDRIMLPPDFDDSDRERMLHCDMTITGLPASIFYGSGYGPRAHYAKYSAAKDMVEKCHRIGVVSSELYAAIGDWEHIDQEFKIKFGGHIQKAMNAVVLLTKRIAMEELPAGFMTVRHLPSELIDKFKTMLRMVMMDVYYQGTDESAVGVPKGLETNGGGYDSYQPRHRDEPQRYEEHHRRYEEPRGPSAEEILRQKQKELEEKMEMELAKKRQELEQEIREKFLKEEREKLQAELEREKTLELIKIQQQQFQIEKERKELEESQRKSAMLKRVEEDFNAMVEQFGKRFEEVRSKGVQPVLNMIYASATYKTIQLYSTTLTSLSSEQKQQLAQDLRSLLDSISVAMSMQPSPILPGMHQQQQQSMLNPMMGGGYSQALPMGPIMGGWQVPPSSSQMIQQQMPQQPGLVTLPPMNSGIASSGSKRDEVRRVTLGNMTLRALTASEQRRLTKDDKVIAQDSKTGSWSLATVVKIRDNRATLAVGQTTWKKYLDELYKEEEQRY